MSSSIKNKTVKINLNIGDQLTSISCGHVVVEVIKFIAYQRLQIPYSYQWLKQVVTKKKMCSEEIKDSFQSERHFRIASSALQNLDFINKSLLQEIGGPSCPDEVCIALGATPVTCKEVYRLILPLVCHKPQCHSSQIANDQKIQRTVFRSLVTSETLSQTFFSSLPPTNMYVFLKKKNSEQDDVLNADNFVVATGCRIPRNSRIIVIDFRSQNQENIACCNDFPIFGDVISNNLENLQIQDDLSEEEEFNEIESTDSIKWFQSSYVMKGFKDCIVNGRSIINSWMES